MFTNKRKLYSQNFLYNRQLIKKLIRKSAIGSQDFVIEIGAGKGVITSELLGVAKRVTALELDKQLYERLTSKLPQSQKLILKKENILKYSLPETDYKVFANIPFKITGDIVRKLLLTNNPPSDCFLIMQREAAYKFIAKKSNNNLVAILYYPWWKIEINHRFKRRDFSPPPGVDSVMVRFSRRETPLLDAKHNSLYQDFIAGCFNKDRSAKSKSPRQWIILFSGLLNTGDDKKIQSVKGTFERLLHEQKKLKKIHRTRIDKRWRDFKDCP